MNKPTLKQPSDFVVCETFETPALLKSLTDAVSQENIAQKRLELSLRNICARPVFMTNHLEEIEALLVTQDLEKLFETLILEFAATTGYAQRAFYKLQNFARRHHFLEAFEQAQESKKLTTVSQDESSQVKNSIIRHAKLLAGKIEIDPRLVEILFSHRQQQQPILDEWEADFRFATALEKVSSSEKSKLALVMHPDVDLTWRNLIPQDRAVLYITAHTGFTGPRNLFMKRFMKNTIVFRRQSDKPPYEWKKDDGHTALFSCLRALKSGTSVILAPDGPVGGSRTSIKVLNFKASITTGGAFLGHEAKVDVFWFNIEFKNGYFEPVFRKAPSPLPKEKLKDYQVRFVAFYEDILNQYFKGDPRNIVVRPRWNSVFQGDPDNEFSVDAAVSTAPEESIRSE